MREHHTGSPALLAAAVLILACAGDDGTSAGTGAGTTTITTTSGTSGTGPTGTGSGSASGATTTSGSGTGTTSASGGTTSDSGTTSTSTSGSSSSGGTSGGSLAACQHAWAFDNCPDDWQPGVADPNAPGAVSWACGDPPNALSLGGAHLGVWATNLNGDYNEDEASFVESPSFSLADCAGATIYLSVAHLYDYGSGDGGTIQISTTAGQSWTTIEPSWNGYCPGTLDVPFTPPGGEPGFCGGDDELWLHSLIPLDAYGGEPDVRVRFVNGSNGIIERLGWYIDRVAVEAY